MTTPDQDPVAAVERALAMLERLYPSDVFTGESGDPLPVALAAARAALPELRTMRARLEWHEAPHVPIDSDHPYRDDLEPRGCATPGCCSAVETIGMLRARASEYRALLQDALAELERSSFVIPRDNLAARIRAALEKP